MGFNDTEPPALRVDVFPAKLHARSRVHVLILDIYRWDTYYLFWTFNGGSENTDRIFDPVAASGTVDHDFHPSAPGVYTFQVQGCPVRMEGPAPPGDGDCSPRSDMVTVVAAANETHMRKFLESNGVDPSSSGLRSYGVPSLSGLLNGD